MKENLSKKDLDINVEYLTRVEGHGNIVVNVKNGQLEKCELEIIEAPRFFEAMVKDRPIFEVQHLTSRICGICSATHSTASVKASEAAIGYEVTEQTKKLRKLLLNAEMLDSHLLHAYFLVAPDALGAPSVLPLVKTHKEVVLRALRMKKAYSDVFDIMAGRHTHPISICPRGWTKLPTEAELKKMKSILESTLEDLKITVETFKTVELPAFERETEYLALTHPDEYAIYEGKIASSDTDKMIDPDDYLEFVHEFDVAHSTAKHSKNKRDSYMVGALARCNINFDQLNDEAKGVAEALGFKVPNYNPYMNTVAQVVEIAHCTYDSIRILDDFIENGIDPEEKVESWMTDDEWEDRKFTPGTGAGLVEAPRGLLIHEYTVNEKGMVTKANCVIPTNQNLANIDLDMKKLVPEFIDKSKEEITLLSEMLVRAYDPCISCSTHMLDVKFIEE